MMIIDNWINENKEKLFNEIRTQRSEIIVNLNQFPITEYMKLVEYKTKLDVIEYLLIKED